MEDANGGLYILEGFIPTIGKKRKIVGSYEGWRMRGSQRKRTGNNTIVPIFVDGFQYFEIKDNRGSNEDIC